MEGGLGGGGWRIEGGHDRVALRRPHYHHKDVGSNPTSTRNENGHWEVRDSKPEAMLL